MAWWNCCCDATCLIHEDFFYRPPGTPLRGRWCDEEGDYEIVAAIIDEQCGGAKCLVADALAILNVRHPVPEGSMLVTLDTCDEVVDSGDKYRVLLNLEPTKSGNPVVCDSQNYYFVEFERQGTTPSVLRLGIVSGGVETILKEDDILGLTGNERTLYGLITDNVLCGGVSSAVLSQVATVHSGLFADGYYSGFSLSGAGMTIRRFSFSRHLLEAAPFGVCAQCICTCDGIDGSMEWGPTLTAKIYVYPPAVPCVRLDQMETVGDPCVITLEWNRLEETWEGEGLCCGLREFFRMEFLCVPNGYGGIKHVLKVFNGCMAQFEIEPTELDCSKPCALFGPIVVPSLWLLCVGCSSCTVTIPPPPAPPNPIGCGDCSYIIEICAEDA